eukprot:SAG31_NODE_5634_length_2412_cov_1.487678_2_plen_120_part_01
MISAIAFESKVATHNILVFWCANCITVLGAKVNMISRSMLNQIELSKLREIRVRCLAAPAQENHESRYSCSFRGECGRAYSAFLLIWQYLKEYTVLAFVQCLGQLVAHHSCSNNACSFRA